jgi:hypothetical protein
MISWPFNSFRGRFAPLFLAVVTLVFASPTLAEKGKLRERLTPDVMAVVYPGAERLGSEEGRRQRLRSTGATRP